jgi:hypothetical protein
MKLGRLHWAVIGLVTAALVVMAPSDNEGEVAKTTRSTKQPPINSASLASTSNKNRSQEVGRVELERLAKPESQQPEKRRVGDVFNATSWYVPPPPPRFVPPPPAAPPPIVVPTAPPLPFTYLGRYGDTASRTIILSKGERVYTVAVGDVIENTYRVEKLTAGMVNLTYLPLNIQQSLRTGEAL